MDWVEVFKDLAPLGMVCVTAIILSFIWQPYLERRAKRNAANERSRIKVEEDQTDALKKLLDRLESTEIVQSTLLNVVKSISDLFGEYRTDSTTKLTAIATVLGNLQEEIDELEIPTVDEIRAMMVAEFSTLRGTLLDELRKVNTIRLTRADVQSVIDIALTRGIREINQSLEKKLNGGKHDRQPERLPDLSGKSADVGRGVGPTNAGGGGERGDPGHDPDLHHLEGKK